MKNKELDNILNECLERMFHGETVEQCLQSYPEQALELEPMLRTAVAFGKISVLQPRPEFKARARYEFHSAFREMETKKRRRLFSGHPQWATALVAVLAVFLLGGSTVAAAAKSMPDGPLYPVKLATEEAKLAFAGSNERKAQLYAEMAENRVDEIAYVAGKGKAEQVELIAQRLNSHLARVAVLATGVVKAPKRAVEEGPVAFSAPAPAPRVPLPGPTPTPPTTQAPSEQTTAPEPGTAATALGPRKGVIPGPQGQAKGNYKGTTAAAQDKKHAILREMVKRQAMKNPDRLRAILEATPEEYGRLKEALHRAIALSEQAYERTLGSIDDDAD